MFAVVTRELFSDQKTLQRLQVKILLVDGLSMDKKESRKQ